MHSNDHVSVLTGDLVGFTKGDCDPERYLKDLEGALMLITRTYSFSYQMFRGDSFQGMLLNPSMSLRAALLLRSYLISLPLHPGNADYMNRPKGGKSTGASSAAAGKRHDVRIAIGIGKADFYDLNDIGRSDGEAFRMSGLKLDEMKNMKRNLVIVTPWDDLNGELDVECALLDVVISKWTRGQALSVFYSLQGLNQYQIAERLGLYQGGISQRLAKAGYWAIEMMLARFDEMIDEHDLGSISSRTRGYV